MLIQETVARNFVGDELGEAGSMQISALLQLHEFIDHIWRRNNPAKPDSGSQRLGESAEINDIANRVAVVAAPRAGRVREWAVWRGLR